MMWPWPCRIICGYAAATPWTTPRTLMSMMAFHWSNVSSSVSPPQTMPALLNIRSSCPVRVDHAVDRGLHGGRIGDVEASRPGAERCRGRRGGVAVDVGAEHLGAGGHQRAAQRRADPDPAPVTSACLPDSSLVTPGPAS